MAQFSINSTRDFRVATAVASSVTNASINGTINPEVTAEDLYFIYKSPDNVVRTELIPKGNILSAKAFSYTKGQRGLKKVKVVFDTDVNEGQPIAGQTYGLRIDLRALNTPSPEDLYFKHASAKATSGMTTTQLLTALKTNLEASLAKEGDDILDVAVVAGVEAVTAVASKFVGTVAGMTSPVTIVADTAGEDGDDILLEGDGVSTIAELVAAWNTANATNTCTVISGTTTQVPDDGADIALDGGVDAVAGSAAYMTISEVEQPWTLGLRQEKVVTFKVTTLNVRFTADGLSYEEAPWGIVTNETPSTIVGNGKTVADMEFFYMGERGDTYRNVGYPYVLKTTYLADPTKEYCFIEITYFYQGVGTNNDRTEKQLTIAIPAVGDDNAAKITLTNSLISAINTAYGSTLVAALS
jgi:hypothetical protein